MKLSQLFIESVIVGICLLIIGTIISYFIDKSRFDSKIAKYGTSLKFFISGILIHVLFEITGINQWYCINRAIKLD